jgi:tyrosine-protein kinase Etk/Wzc
MPHFRNNIVMFAGPTRGLGKSFVSANFAAVMAASGKRVLLIDADLRNGHLHRYFGVSRERDCRGHQWGRCRGRGHHPPRRAREPRLHPDRRIAAEPFRIPAAPELRHLLEAVSRHYDLVLLDPPPMLAVADALIIGAHAGAVFIVARGQTTEGEINESIKRLNHAGISPRACCSTTWRLRLGGYGAYRHANPAGRIGFAGR